ncbi:MAG: 16S rRNA (cytidine(1402)-2'-O)-methyltransferase [Candidatus Moduliflexus flocculans]|nr:16S rRNA (cytidine(1402)-2'-O)-methyltransferase [Candidatus Moduliflexus flocculans]
MVVFYFFFAIKAETRHRCQQQKAFDEDCMNKSAGEKQGTLYMVATPIGNLEDITLRALRVLKEVDLIAAEDTRHSRILLSAYNIKTPLISLHEHNEKERSALIVSRIKGGMNVAYISDAGTPCISDPGSHLVSFALENKISVIPVPGPSALIAALSVCGFPADQFLFCGFLPPKEKSAAGFWSLFRLKKKPWSFMSLHQELQTCCKLFIMCWATGRLL